MLQQILEQIDEMVVLENVRAFLKDVRLTQCGDRTNPFYSFIKEHGIDKSICRKIVEHKTPLVYFVAEVGEEKAREALAVHDIHI